MTTFSNSIAQIQALYVGYFGRAGDPAGTNYWAGQVAGGYSVSSLAASYSIQPESLAKYPFLAAPLTTDPTTFINQVYQNLFNRAPDTAGLEYWKGQLTAAAGNPQRIGAFILDVMSGATGTDNTILLNKVDVATDFTTKAGSSTWTSAMAAQSLAEIALTDATAASVATQKAASSAFFNVTPSTQVDFTLNVDTLTSSVANASFVGNLAFNPGTGTLLQTLQSGDSATATGTGASLTATLNVPGVLTNVTLSGIQSATITNQTAGNANAGVSGTVTGLTTLTNSNSTAPLTMGAATRGLNTALSTLNVSGSPNSGANTDVIVAAAALAGTSDMVTVNLTGVTGSATTATGAAQIVLRNDGAAGTSGTPNNAYETETFTATATTFAQLSNTASGVLSTTALNLSGAGAMQLSAASGGDFANLTKIDASGSTGGVTITGATNVNTAGAAFNAGAAGLLTTNTKLTSFSGGTGADRLDISNMTLAQVGAFTTLSGSGGTDTLLVAASVLNTTTMLPNVAFETLGVNAGLNGTVDFSKLGTNVDTIQLFGTVANNVTLNNAPSGLTLAMGTFANTNAFTVNGPTASADSLNISHSIVGGAGGIGALVTSGFETVTLTGLPGTTNPNTIASITATPTAGNTVTLNIINDQNPGQAYFVAGATNIGATGTLNVSGTGTGGVTFGGDITAGVINASGLNTAASSTTAGFIMNGKSLTAITFAGSNGRDIVRGSTAADSINGGAGDDQLANLASGAGGASAGDTLMGGSGSDQFILRGDVASGSLVTILGTTAHVTDMAVDAATTTDFITVAASAAAYAVNIGTGGLKATGGLLPGNVTVQPVAANAGTNAMTNAASEILKLTTGVVTTNLTFQQAFNAAIGSTVMNGTTNFASHFFTMYDITNGRMLVGIVQDDTGGTGTINTGDAVALIGSATMSAADYANINTNHFSFGTS